MKRLPKISNQIKNNTYSYTGKGAFEEIANKYKEEIINWLEDLVPLQKQIEYLHSKENVDFQKRNYTRILSKLLPNEYNEFVSLNILIRDSSVIATHYQKELDLAKLYKYLVSNKYLKYLGKYDRYVEFEIFQKFIIMYKEDLIFSLKDSKQIQNNEIKNKEHTATIQKKEEISQDEIQKNEKIKSKKNTNWTNLLLGR